MASLDRTAVVVPAKQPFLRALCAGEFLRRTGFQVALIGRFCVIPEGADPQARRARRPGSAGGRATARRIHRAGVKVLGVLRPVSGASPGYFPTMGCVSFSFSLQM